MTVKHPSYLFSLIVLLSIAALGVRAERLVWSHSKIKNACNA